MSFSENTWKTGDVITADLLNRLEQALASHDTNISSLLSNLGDLSQLSTSSRGSLVAALNEVKGIIPVGGSGGSGSLVYNTLTDLQNAYPGGTTQPAWVIGDNAWYYWSGTTVSIPADVTALSTGSITQTSLSLSWTGSTNAISYDVYNGATLLGNTTSTTYSVTGLTAGTAYTFKVVAKNSAGSASGATVNATTTALTPPADVTNLATSNVSNASVTLAWTASATATSYDVYNGATLLGNTTSTSYQATGLTASTAYTFKVVAKNASGSSTGVTVTATTLASAPNPVTALTAGTIQPSTVAISWTAPSGGTAVDHYEVAYEASGATSYTVSSNAVNSSSTSFTVTNLHQSTSYTIRVVGIDASGNRSQATTVSATTIALTASASPAAGTFTSSQTVTLSSNGVAGTNIYYTTDGTTPTASSTLYSSAISVSATETIKFFAQNPVGDQSAVQTAAYTINLPDTTPPVVTASPAAGTYTSAQTVTLSATDNSGGAVTIYYTTDGTTPTTASTVYTAPISISATTNLQYIGKDTAGNISTSVSSTYTINASILPITDSFNRADTTSGLGNTDTGQAWVDTYPVFGISSNQAYNVTGASGYALVNAKQSDYTVQVTNVTKDNNQRLIFRSDSAFQTYLIINNEGSTYKLYSNTQASGFVSIGSLTGATATGDVLKVVCSGSSISCYLNGTLALSATSTVGQTNTYCGIGNTGSTADRWDSFSITA